MSSSSSLYCYKSDHIAGSLSDNNDCENCRLYVLAAYESEKYMKEYYENKSKVEERKLAKTLLEYEKQNANADRSIK